MARRQDHAAHGAGDDQPGRALTLPERRLRQTFWK
jgi:hypothetical protein